MHILCILCPLYLCLFALVLSKQGWNQDLMQQALAYFPGFLCNWKWFLRNGILNCVTCKGQSMDWKVYGLVALFSRNVIESCLGLGDFLNLCLVFILHAEAASRENCGSCKDTSATWTQWELALNKQLFNLLVYPPHWFYALLLLSLAFLM